MAVLMERCGGRVTARRINALDTYVPLGPAADTVLPLEPTIVQAVRDLVAACPLPVKKTNGSAPKAAPAKTQKKAKTSRVPARKR
jgi:hypothetical protein